MVSIKCKYKCGKYKYNVLKGTSEISINILSWRNF